MYPYFAERIFTRDQPLAGETTWSLARDIDLLRRLGGRLGSDTKFFRYIWSFDTMSNKRGWLWRHLVDAVDDDFCTLQFHKSSESNQLKFFDDLWRAYEGTFVDTVNRLTDQ